MTKIQIGMKVYCDIHSRSKKHTVTGLREKLGWAEIDNEFLWPLSSCFPCSTITLPSREEELEKLRKMR